MKKKIIGFFKSQTVLCISIILAIASMIIVLPGKEYLGYINFATLILLFSLMGAVCGMRKCGIFDTLAAALTKKCKSVRAVTFLLMNVCFFTSMFITNDVALITFVPVTILIFENFSLKSKNALPTAIIIETAAANLGSMLLPTGNPQNIFLCSFYGITPVELIKTLLPFGLLSYIILSLSILLLPSGSFSGECKTGNSSSSFSIKTTICCSVIFVISLLTVSGIINEYICLAVSVVLIAISGIDIFKKIDYALLLTFICFFIFTGNLGRIEAVQNFLSDSIEGRELLISVLASQIFSNVPASILLSGFTSEAGLLLIGTNIGGLGTPIASLASLISFKIYASEKKSSPGKYMLLFTVYNFIFLALLCFFSTIIL